MFHESYRVFSNNECPQYEVRWELLKGGSLFTIYYVGKEVDRFIRKNIVRTEDAKNVSISYIYEVFRRE